MVTAVFSEDFLHSHGHHILWPLLVHDWLHSHGHHIRCPPLVHDWITPHRHHIRWPLLVYDWIQNCDSKQCAVTSVNLRGMKHQSGSQRLLLLYARYTMVLRVHDWIKNSASKQCAVDWQVWISNWSGNEASKRLLPLSHHINMANFHCIGHHCCCQWHYEHDNSKHIYCTVSHMNGAW